MTQGIPYTKAGEEVIRQELAETRSRRSSRDPLDLVTWPQYRAAFEVAAAVLQKIASGTADPRRTASDALRAMRDRVRRLDDTEPSWEPQTSETMERRSDGSNRS